MTIKCARSGILYFDGRLTTNALKVAQSVLNLLSSITTIKTRDDIRNVDIEPYDDIEKILVFTKKTALNDVLYKISKSLDLVYVESEGDIYMTKYEMVYMLKIFDAYTFLQLKDKEPFFYRSKNGSREIIQ